MFDTWVCLGSYTVSRRSTVNTLDPVQQLERPESKEVDLSRTSLRMDHLNVISLFPWSLSLFHPRISSMIITIF